MDNSSSYWDPNDVTSEATFDEFGDRNDSMLLEEDAVLKAVTHVVVPVIFSFISVLGFVGNLSVIVVVASNMQMRSTTNTLIISLAMADLLFIVTCVPFTAVAYNSVWPFGTVWCKIYHFSIHVTAYVSVYTLVLMSLDRYLAVVHPIRSMTLRTPRNAAIAVLSATTVICLGNSFMFTAHDVIEYSDGSTNLTLCVNVRIANEDFHYGCLFYGSFFALAFAVPLSLVCLLYGLMLRRLRQRKGPASTSSSSASTTTSSKSPATGKRRQLINTNEPNHKASDGASNKPAATTQAAGRAASKRRVTRLVVVVVVTFAAYWLPFQVTLVTQFCAPDSVFDTSTLVFIKIAANCLAYMNSCVNPILYAFLSEPFRKSFRRLLVCRLWGQSSGGTRSPDQRGRRAASQKAASKRYQTGQKAAAAPSNVVIGGQTPPAVTTTTANGRPSTAVVNGRNNVGSESPDCKERIVQLVDCHPTADEQQQLMANGQAQLLTAAAAAAETEAAAAEVDLLCETETNL